MSELTKAQVNDVMLGMSTFYRYYWCGGGVCGCMGCANVSGGASGKGVTKDQWKEWVEANPDPTPQEDFMTNEEFQQLFEND